MSFFGSHITAIDSLSITYLPFHLQLTDMYYKYFTSSVPPCSLFNGRSFGRISINFKSE